MAAAMGLTLAGLIPILCLPLGGKARAQDSENRTIYARQPLFRVPFVLTDPAERLREVRLFVSEDEGRTWKRSATVAPEDGGFQFRAERSGMHWFTVQAVDIQGRPNPPTVQGTRPQLRVVIDTQAPQVTLRARQGREGMVGVEWDVRDDNLDLGSFNLECRATGGDWMPLSLTDPGPVGERFWAPGNSGAVEVRLRVRDLAKNESEQKITILPGGQEYRTASNPNEGERPANVPLPATRHVNSKRISLNYEIQELPPSGVPLVELWVTRDGRKWDKFNEQKHEEKKLQGTYVFNVNDEGIFGFTLIPRNGIGLGDPPPRSGDAPQVWVEVDLTPPIVHWVETQVGRGPDTGNLTILWKATDKNLAGEPIAISYAEEAQGTWTKIESNLPNSGKYVWKKGGGPPHRFLIKVEAADRARNVGEAMTREHVKFDLTLPKSRIVDVQPAGKE